ncbi:hypothetical protein MMC13_001432 [Lambiella insularis]|nr:hypothetical protein [Lambiella insularis]
MATNGAAYTRSASSYKFQLPPIRNHLESLTTGTDIPPPPPSPPPRTSSRDKAPAPPPKSPGTPNPLQQHPSTSSFALPLNASIPGAFPLTPVTSPSPEPPTALPQIDYVTSKPRTPSSTLPRESTSSGRPNSVRKFLSLRSLSGGWNNQNTRSSTDSTGLRPESPGGISTTSSYRPSLKKKRSSLMWGRRQSSLMLGTRYEDGAIDGGDHKAAENQENVQPIEKELPARPSTPPPMLPELEKLGGGLGYGNGGFLDGDDMFRNIK